MTLRDEITKKRKELWRDSDLTEMGEAQDLIIDRIDDIEEIVINKEFDIVKRLSEIEDEIVNLNTYIHNLKPFPTTQPPVSIPNIPEEVLRDAIEIFKATVAEKKRELDQGPMTDSEVMKHHGLDLSAAHDFTGPGEHPEE